MKISVDDPGDTGLDLIGFGQYGFAADISGSGDQGTAELARQKVMQRAVGKHDADLPQARSYEIRKRSAAALFHAFDGRPQHLVQVFHREVLFVTGFYRDNLFLQVTPVAAQEKKERLLQRIQEKPKVPTIVYVTLQKTAENIAAMTLFKKAGYRVTEDSGDRLTLMKKIWFR